MKFYIEQRVFSWTDRFDVYAESGETLYRVEGEFLTLGKRLHLYAGESEIAYIEQQIWHLLPRYEVSMPDGRAFTVYREWSFFHPRYTLSNGWTVEGEIWAHNYRVLNETGALVATVDKEWFTFGDCYALDVCRDADAIPALCALIVIDCVLAAEND